MKIIVCDTNRILVIGTEVAPVNSPNTGIKMKQYLQQ